MRLDPDAIMEGEMRDLISMMSTTYAAQTGHIVLTTLHTNSALGIPERMITMGMNADLICDAQLLIGMISQRLVPTVPPAVFHGKSEHLNLATTSVITLSGTAIKIHSAVQIISGSEIITDALNVITT